MSYEEDYRRPYSAKCACGKGYLQFYRIYLSNDWGQEKENDTADRKSTRLNSSHKTESRMPSSA